MRGSHWLLPDQVRLVGWTCKYFIGVVLVLNVIHQDQKQLSGDCCQSYKLYLWILQILALPIHPEYSCYSSCCGIAFWKYLLVEYINMYTNQL
jgi:hypothetical protein